MRHHAVCEALGASNIGELSDIMTHRTLSAGDVILHQGESSQLFAVIMSGVVKLTQILPDGREQIVGLLSAANSLGNPVSSVSNENAECVTDVKLCCFRRAQFGSVLRANPEIEHRLLEQTINDLRQARQWMTVLGKLGAQEKMARFILWLWKENRNICLHRDQREPRSVIYFPLKREEIAGLLGMTIETVSRNISKLKADGIIDLLDAKSIELRDVPRLQQIAQIYEDD
ncbi:MAG: Crp/Fnr family transcriptional regulator [Thiogranum sp.]